MFNSLRYSSHRYFSLSRRKENFFQNLFQHFQYAQKAKQAAKQRGIDLNNLTAEQQLKLQPILRLKKTFRVINVVMSLMAISALTVWYRRKKQNWNLGKEIDQEYQPIWMNLKYFRTKCALIKGYLLPEQIISKLNQIEHFQFHNEDIICASFPKSGTTLIQEIVFLLQTNFDYDLAKQLDISERFAFIEWPSTKLNSLSNYQFKQNRFFKTHLPPRFFNQSFQKAKIIYIYRNPKDVTVSLFHFLRSINIELTYSGPWNQFVESFLIDEVYYGPWWKHLNDYQTIEDQIFFVSYEDLLTNFRETVRQLAKYLGKEKDLSEDQLDKLEKWCSFKSMKENSKVNYDWFKDWGFVQKSFSFLRKGQIGDWLNHFDPQQSIKYDQMIENKLSKTIPQLNFGISKEDQQKIYDLHLKKISSSS